jgi:hypothetical protein
VDTRRHPRGEDHHSKTLRRLKEHHAGNWDDWRPYDRPETPIIHPQSSVGTVLYYVLEMIEKGRGGDWHLIDEVHLVGFPLCFDGDVQHWTEEKQPYTVGGESLLAGTCVRQDQRPTYHLAIRNGGGVRQYAALAGHRCLNHGGGLLDIPTIGDLWQFHTEEPQRQEYEI